MDLQIAISFVASGRWRAYISIQDYPHLESILKEKLWTQFWRGDTLQIQYSIAANIRLMFTTELVIDNYSNIENTVLIPPSPNSRPDAYAVPIDTFYYPLFPVENVQKVEEESASGESVESEDTPKPLRYLTELVGNNPLFAKPSLNKKPAQYALFEKVLADLKSCTGHCEPFLQKVPKHIAPDYYQIIKNPMDLGTVGKKLKALQYTSKKEFSDDLYLIWSNCMTYSMFQFNIDTHIDNPYRKHGAAMKKRTTELLKRIPDDKSNDGESDSEEEPLDTDRRDSATPSLEPVVEPNGNIENELDAQTEDQDQNEPVFYRKWKQVTYPVRSKIQKMRKSKPLEFSERKAIVTRPSDYQLFLLGEDMHNKRNRFAQSMKLDEHGAIVRDDVYETDPLTRMPGFETEVTEDISVSEFFLVC